LDVAALMEVPMKRQVTRRQFLNTGSKTAAVAAAGLSMRTLIREAGAVEANEKHTVALIGCGGMGTNKLINFMDTKQCNVAAICDVDDGQLAKTADIVEKKMGKAPKKVKNYKEIMDMKDVQIVIVGTPDHWHAIPMIAAVKAGKDVYCEKPCCHNIREGRVMVDMAMNSKQIVQVGTHQRSSAHINEAREYIQSGKLGTIVMTNTYTYGNESPTGMGQAPDQPPPKGLDYDMWLGPAPERPFNPRRFIHSWRWYFDYAAGMVGDWNVHLQDIIMWTMGVTHATSVSTVGGKFALEDDRDTPDTMQAVYEFGQCERAPKGFVQTYTMRKASGKPWNRGGYGMEFHGTNGRMLVTRNGWKVESDAKDEKNEALGLRVESFDKPGKDSHPEHVVNFLDCVRSRSKPVASIELHYNTVAACHLANVSLRSGQKIFWDPKKELCFSDRELTTEAKEANKFLSREYRKGYELPV
jgi:predicted dehydrogenase